MLKEEVLLVLLRLKKNEGSWTTRGKDYVFKTRIVPKQIFLKCFTVVAISKSQYFEPRGAPNFNVRAVLGLFSEGKGI